MTVSVDAGRVVTLTIHTIMQKEFITSHLSQLYHLETQLCWFCTHFVFVASVVEASRRLHYYHMELGDQRGQISWPDPSVSREM